MTRSATAFAISLMLTALLLGATGCIHTLPFRCYNLETGEMLVGSYEDNGTGHGSITLTTSTGKELKGEWTTISEIGWSTSYGTASAVGPEGYAWARAQGFSFNQPGKAFGSATVAGDGFVVDVVYVVDWQTSHGYGVGKDNNGGKYKVHF